MRPSAARAGGGGYRAPGIGRGHHRGACAVSILATPTAIRVCRRQLRRPGGAARGLADAGLPAHLAARAPRPVAALSQGHAPACRAPEPGSGQGPAAPVAGAAVLAGLAAAPGRWRRCRGVGGFALAARGMARFPVCAGAQDCRAGVGQAPGARLGTPYLTRCTWTSRLQVGTSISQLPNKVGLILTCGLSALVHMGLSSPTCCHCWPLSRLIRLSPLKPVKLPTICAWNAWRLGVGRLVPAAGWMAGSAAVTAAAALPAAAAGAAVPVAAPPCVASHWLSVDSSCADSLFKPAS